MIDADIRKYKLRNFTGKLPADLETKTRDCAVKEYHEFSSIKEKIQEITPKP